MTRSCHRGRHRQLQVGEPPPTSGCSAFLLDSKDGVVFGTAGMKIPWRQHKRDCYYFKRTINQKNTPDRTRTIQTVEINQGSTSDDFSGFAFMTGDYQQENDDDKVSFLLDSGASDHIINRDDLFIAYENLNTPVKISIAKNGEFISATKQQSMSSAMPASLVSWRMYCSAARCHIICCQSPRCSRLG